MGEVTTIERGVGGGPQVRKAPAGRWDGEIEQAFLAHLSDTANVTASARAAGTTKISAYRHRAADPAFRAAWTAALEEGYAKLETMLLGRALNGTLKPVWYGGKRVGKDREYSDRLALQLMAKHGAAVMSARRGVDAAEAAEAHQRIEEKLAEMRARIEGGDASSSPERGGGPPA